MNRKTSQYRLRVTAPAADLDALLARMVGEVLSLGLVLEGSSRSVLDSYAEVVVRVGDDGAARFVGGEILGAVRSLPVGNFSARIETGYGVHKREVA